MKNKISLLILEIILSITIITMVVGMKFTYMSPIALVKVLSFAYTAVAGVMIAVIVRQLGKSDEEGYTSSEAEADLARLFRVSRTKGLTRYAETIEIQLQKLENRTAMLKRMLAENFGEDSHAEEISAILEEHRMKFFRNVDKVADRVEIMDLSGINTNLSVNSNLKEESRRIYQEHIDYIEGKINTNEKINIELDKLTTELSRINDSDGENNLEPLEDYIKALKSLNDNTTNNEIDKLMQKY